MRDQRQSQVSCVDVKVRNVAARYVKLVKLADARKCPVVAVSVG